MSDDLWRYDIVNTVIFFYKQPPYKQLVLEASKR